MFEVKRPHQRPTVEGVKKRTTFLHVELSPRQQAGAKNRVVCHSLAFLRVHDEYFKIIINGMAKIQRKMTTKRPTV